MSKPEDVSVEAVDTADTGETSTSAMDVQVSFYIKVNLYTQIYNFKELGQNESSSDTTSKGEDFDTKVEADRGKRFDFLLKQTEIFSHFMNQAKTPTKPKSGRPRKEKKEEVIPE